MSLLEVQNVSKAFGGIHALNTCSISVEEGSITGLIGPNGSGKTTLFNVITGYEKVDTGTIRLRGQTLTNVKPDKVFRLGIGRTFQLTRIFPRLTVMENMHVAAQREGIKELLSRWSSTHEQKRAQELLDFVGLSKLKDMPAANLSYGQKKLLEFAFVLIAEPQGPVVAEPEPQQITAQQDRDGEQQPQSVGVEEVPGHLGRAPAAGRVTFATRRRRFTTKRAMSSTQSRSVCSCRCSAPALRMARAISPRWAAAAVA